MSDAPPLDRVREQDVDEAHDGLRVLVASDRGACRIDFAGLDLAQDARHGEVVSVRAVDELLELGPPGQEGHDLDLPLELRAQMVERDHVARVGHRHRHPPRRPVLVALEGEADHEKATRDGHRDRTHGVRFDHGTREVHALDAERASEGIAHDRLGDESEAHQEVGDARIGVALLGACDADLVLAHRPGFHQQLRGPVEAVATRIGSGGSKARAARRHFVAGASISRAAMRPRAIRSGKAAGKSDASSTASR